MKKEQKVCTFMVSKEMWTRFDEICKSEGMNVSEKLRRYIKTIIKEYEQREK